MYNKAVVTLFLVAVFAAAGHAQYYTSSYAPISYAYANAQYSGSSVDAGAHYFTQRYATVYQRPSALPVKAGFAYAANPLTPTYGSRSPDLGSVNFAYNPSSFLEPTYGSGFSGAPFVLSYQPGFISPTYGSGSFGLGDINFNLPRHEIPNYPSMSFGHLKFGFQNNFQNRFFLEPIYATPSRALLNTEVGFGTYWTPYY